MPRLIIHSATLETDTDGSGGLIIRASIDGTPADIAADIVQIARAVLVCADTPLTTGHFADVSFLDWCRAPSDAVDLDERVYQADVPRSHGY